MTSLPMVSLVEFDKGMSKRTSLTYSLKKQTNSGL